MVQRFKASQTSSGYPTPVHTAVNACLGPRILYTHSETNGGLFTLAALHILTGLWTQHGPPASREGKMGAKQGITVFSASVDVSSLVTYSSAACSAQVRPLPPSHPQQVNKLCKKAAVPTAPLSLTTLRLAAAAWIKNLPFLLAAKASSQGHGPFYHVQ